jgi:hypothetical protein
MTKRHSVLSGVQVLVTRTPEHTHWLAHVFMGLLIVTTEKGIKIEKSHIQHWLILSGVSSYCDKSERVYIFCLWYKGEITSKHPVIWLNIGVLVIGSIYSRFGIQSWTKYNNIKFILTNMLSKTDCMLNTHCQMVI